MNKRMAGRRVAGQAIVAAIVAAVGGAAVLIGGDTVRGQGQPAASRPVARIAGGAGGGATQAANNAAPGEAATPPRPTTQEAGGMMDRAAQGRSSSISTMTPIYPLPTTCVRSCWRCPR